MFRRQFLQQLGTTVFLTAALGCGNAEPADSTSTRAEDGAPINVVCTTEMVADVVRNVGGSNVKVTALMKEGVDPHLYKPSPGDIALLRQADMIFYSGQHLEGKMIEVFDRIGKTKPTIAITGELPIDRLLRTEEGSVDPHVWFDVELWSMTIPVVKKALQKFDSHHGEQYLRNAEGYREELITLDANTRRSIAAIPKEQRVLVTAHDAFEYFGKAYDINVKAIQGISTESEAGVQSINELVDFLAANKIKAVFVETSVSDRNIKALLEGAKAKGHNVVIGGELYSDAMGAPGTPAGTYIGMIDTNVATITKALK